MNNIVKLPPFKVKNIVSTLSQVHGWGIKQLNVPTTWSITKGEGIIVMVIDTGYCNHSDLEEAIIVDKCKSFVENEKDITDYSGHSCHCMGIVGARDNDIGMVGVAPECKIISVKVLGADGTGDLDGIIKALKYAIKIKPHVINMSLGTSEDNPQIHKLIKKLYDLNIPIIAAAGNDGRKNSVNYPAAYPETICVTAYDKNGKPAKFNSTGKETEFSAPGVDIYSTWLNNKYGVLSGTSMSAPFMTGLVALLLSKHMKQEVSTGKNDCKTIPQIREHLKKYSDSKGIIGHDENWGYGVVDPVKLIYGNEEISDEIEEESKLSTVVPETNFNIFKKIISWFRGIFLFP
jgi:subtilisin family serine protease